MASIATGGGASGRKALSIDIPLVPFLDLLLCCVMFLLVTAMWNQLAVLRASQRVPGISMDVPTTPELRLMLTLTAHGYELSSDAGERQLIASGDRQALRSALAARRQLEGGDPSLILTAEDGVRYEAITSAMDDAQAAGYARLEIGSLAL